MAVNKQKSPINITHLYANEMNIYGDSGNVLTLSWRLKKHGYLPNIVKVGIGDTIPTDTDILICGGGQDSGQSVVKEDLLSKATTLKSMIKDGMVTLAICGTYQLLGHYFKLSSGESIDGIGVFDAHTVASDDRLIGNIVVSTPFGELVGFENHSGRTILSDSQLPLGQVIKGYGNDGKSGKEGAVTLNAFGTYLHGPLLPKNPRIADELIKRAIEKRYAISAKLKSLDDELAYKAAKIASSRP